VTTTDLPEESDRFRRRYRLAGTNVLDEVEAEVIGVSFGANGYTTAEQARDLTDRLDLSAGDLVLDVGGGRGWPSRYMQQLSSCNIVVTDPILEGLEASNRVGERNPAAACTGDKLPFRPSIFDAVVHSDVLC